MAFALLIIGVVMLIVAVKGTQSDLAQLVKKEFVGENNFIFWIAAILAIGMVGYVPKLKPLSTALLGLVIVVLFLRKGQGFFPQLVSGLQGTQTAQPAAQGSQSMPNILNMPGISGLATHLIQ